MQHTTQRSTAKMDQFFDDYGDWYSTSTERGIAKKLASRNRRNDGKKKIQQYLKEVVHES